MNADSLLGVVLVLMSVVPTSLSCHYGYLYSFYGSVAVDVGSNATFHCEGDGSYLYWFINGVNTENMTVEEMEERGLSFSGYYNNYCDWQYSHMTIAGNCLNNNSEIYCVILGAYPPPDGGNATSPITNLTINGDPTVVNDLEIFSVDTNTLFISWDAYTSTNNCTFILNIIDSYNSMDTIHLPCCDHAYEYTLNNPDPCNQYNITLTVQTNVSTCINSHSVLISETPAKAKNLTAKIENNSTLFVQFEVYSTLCAADIPNKLELFLVDYNGRYTQSSGLMLWEDIDEINGINEIQWHVLLNNNTFYQIFAISHTILGQAISEPFILSTYDTQELVYTLNGSELCLTCRFVLHSTVKGCTASILLSSTLYHVIMEIPRSDNSAEECLTLSENGTYQISVYDWEKDGVISIKPAVVENIVVNEVPSTLKIDIIKSVSASQSFVIIKSVSASQSVYTQSLDLASTSLTTSEKRRSPEQNTLTVAFGSLFALAMLFLIIIITLWIILIIRKKLYLRNQQSVNKNSNEHGISISTNSAYGTVKFGSGVPVQQPISQPSEPTITSQTGDRVHAYEMVTIDVPPSSGLYENVNF